MGKKLRVVNLICDPERSGKRITRFLKSIKNTCKKVNLLMKGRENNNKTIIIDFL